jgi:nucleoside-diphosphate-sugar epimerase
MIGAHTARALVDLGSEVVVTAHRRIEVPTFLAGRVTVERLDVTDRDAFLALAIRHDISDIVHLAGSIPGDDPVRYFRTDTAGLLNALDAARSWGVRRLAVASSLGVYDRPARNALARGTRAAGRGAAAPDRRFQEGGGATHHSRPPGQRGAAGRAANRDDLGTAGRPGVSVLPHPSLHQCRAARRAAAVIARRRWW